MDLWQRARDEVARRDRRLAQALGFDQCAQCQDWFHHEAEDWADCAGCGRYCPQCAQGIEWIWCEECGLHYCLGCFGSGDGFACGMCQYGTWDHLDG